MASLEIIWPDELHVLPTQVGGAVMLLCRIAPLTSNVAMIAALYRNRARRDLETLDDLSDAASWYGINVAVRLTPNV